jgi:hypothetical protein
MAYSQDDLAAIRAAISGGVLRVRYPDGREIGYQSTEALLKAEQRIVSGLARTPATRSRRSYPGYRNGC